MAANPPAPSYDELKSIVRTHEQHAAELKAIRHEAKEDARLEVAAARAETAAAQAAAAAANEQCEKLRAELSTLKDRREKDKGALPQVFVCRRTQMLGFAAALKAEEDVSIKAGLHVGEIVGSVVGNNRICFDIFGDAVNVASRAMSSARARDSIRCTETFHDMYLACEDGSSSGSQFSTPISVLAKGKGSIQVRNWEPHACTPRGSSNQKH